MHLNRQTKPSGLDSSRDRVDLRRPGRRFAPIPPQASIGYAVRYSDQYRRTPPNLRRTAISSNAARPEIPRIALLTGRVTSGPLETDSTPRIRSAEIAISVLRT